MHIAQVPVILVRFLQKLDYLNRFSKNAQILNFMKIRPAGAELSRAGGWTDRQTCQTVALLNFVNSPTNAVRNSVRSIMVSVSSNHVTNTANSGALPPRNQDLGYTTLS